MKKVYVVSMSWHQEGTEVCAVCSSKKKAKEVKRLLEKTESCSADTYDVQEWELNEVPILTRRA